MHPVGVAIWVFVIATPVLIFLAIYMLGGIVGYFEKPSATEVGPLIPPIPSASSKKEVIIAIIIFALCIAGLVLLWTVVAHHPLIYPHLKEAGIL
jgi:hypothetical protein